jgi:hypothetical protein
MKLSDCADNDSDHLCDHCDKSVSICYDETADHLCDYCGEVFSKCKDLNRDHFCDVCQQSSSLCEDGDNDHLCDICLKALSSCKNEHGNYLCPICGQKIPTIIITAAEDCFVNNSERLVFYKEDVYFEIIPCYKGDPHREVAFWRFYDEKGNLYIEIKNGDSLTSLEYGSYFVTPVFRE